MGYSRDAAELTYPMSNELAKQKKKPVQLSNDFFLELMIANINFCKIITIGQNFLRGATVGQWRRQQR
jgi:hypothetical protein